MMNNSKFIPLLLSLLILPNLAQAESITSVLDSYLGTYHSLQPYRRSVLDVSEYRLKDPVSRYAVVDPKDRTLFISKQETQCDKAKYSRYLIYSTSATKIPKLSQAQDLWNFVSIDQNRPDVYDNDGIIFLQTVIVKDDKQVGLAYNVYQQTHVEQALEDHEIFCDLLERGMKDTTPNSPGIVASVNGSSFKINDVFEISKEGGNRIQLNTSIKLFDFHVRQWGPSFDLQNSFEKL